MINGQKNDLVDVDDLRVILPTVSVIIINYNYAEFLSESINSILEQTYPKIQLIIVDNCSTDNSYDVIESYKNKISNLTVIYRDNNGGQSVGCIDGFAKSSGKFIVFLDADDYLLPTFIETHIYIHLSSRVPVGFTSSDMLQITSDRSLIVGTRQEFSEFIRRNPSQNTITYRNLVGFNTSSPLIRDVSTSFVSPSTFEWVWAPTSGNCFRRDALSIYLGNRELSEHRVETDAYLIFGINGLTGSILIDKPLAVYRFHDRNSWARHPQLNQIISYNPKGNGVQSRKLIISYIIENLIRFLNITCSKSTILEMLEGNSNHVKTQEKELYLSRLAFKNFKTLREAFGFLASIKLLMKWYILKL